MNKIEFDSRANNYFSQLGESVIEKKASIEIMQKASKIAHSTLVVHTNQITTSVEGGEDVSHYAVTFISELGEEIEVKKSPVDVKKYGEIKRIVITDGNKEEELLNGYDPVERLKTYFSTDFDVLRLKINKVDHNGHYSNKYEIFDCQNFSYYLHKGKEGKYSPEYRPDTTHDYREKANHRPYGFYSIKGYKASYRENGRYKGEDMSLHHYVCLADDVFVSKYGPGDVHFTSFQHIKDAYFPKQFVTGKFTVEW